MTARRKDGGGHPHLTIHHLEHRPSWRAHGSGTAYADFEFDADGQWLDIEVTEDPDVGRRRVTMITLEQDEIAALIDFLGGTAADENTRLRNAIAAMTNAANGGLIDDEGRHAILLEIERMGREALATTTQEDGK